MIAEKMKPFVQNNSAIRMMFEEGNCLRAKYGADKVYDFSLGNPSVPAPDCVREAIIDLVNNEEPTVLHGYMNNAGFEDVRETIAQSLNRRFGTAFSAHNLIMTVGAASGLNVILKTILNPGEEVIVFAPYFLEYGAYVRNYDGKLVEISPNTETFQPNLKELEEKINANTRAVIVNTPHNPTGVVYSEETIKELAAILEKKQQEFGSVIYLISDEPYRELAYDGVEVPYLTKYYKNTVVGYSYSKSLSLPGERIGYLVIPDELEDSSTVITAAAIAKRIGILKDLSEACEGAEIENMSDEELRGFVPKISVYARVSPEHKIRIVRAWQERGNIVSMTGDGVNDAPALKQADIGVAMGVTGTEVAKDAAAMVLTDDNFATIVKAVENGRNLYRNIKYAIQFLLSGNFGAILAVLYASIAGLPVPFAPVHLLFINLLTDSLPAIALGVEPHTSDVMNEKPRPADESILTKDFLSKIGLEGLVIGVMTMISFLTGYHQDGALLGSTYAFGTLCLARLFHGYNCKSDHPVIFTKRFFNNKWMQGAFALGAILITAVLTIPGLHQVFKVETLNFEQLGTVYLYAFACFPIIQLLKWVRGKLSE